MFTTQVGPSTHWPVPPPICFIHNDISIKWVLKLKLDKRWAWYNAVTNLYSPNADLIFGRPNFKISIVVMLHY